MKNNRTVVGWLFWPFKYIAGTKALAIGIVAMILISIFGYLGNVFFNGVIGPNIAATGVSSPYIVHAIMQISALFSLTLVFYITARIVSKSAVRLIDIAGTMALSQAPFILVALAGLIPATHLDIASMNTVGLEGFIQIIEDNIVMITLISILSILIIVWTVALKYNAYTISANIRGAKAIVSFIVAIIISEILARIINYIIINTIC